jgi:starch-binding outer membrane protein SusE/F
MNELINFQMKTSFKCLAVVFFIAFFSSCEKEYVLYGDVSAPPALTAPENDFFVKIEPAGTATLEVSWEAAKATDGGLVLYEVLFDKVDGDFSSPVYTVLSDNKGAAATLTLDHKILNKIANAAGIQSLATGNVKWTVVATKGATMAKADAARTLKLERPLGFAEMPAELYLVGSATEAGDAAANAIPFKKKEDGVFELYTSLKAGSYQLITSTGADAKKFFIENNVIKEGETAVTVEGDTRAQRLTFDFNSATYKVVTIDKIELFMAAYNTAIGELTYSGNSSWTGESIPVEFFPFSWGRDERYKFKLITSEGSEFMGSENANNGSPVGAAASYFFLHPVSDSQWDFTYKFDPAADLKNVKAEIFLKPTGPYAHKITVL